MINPEPVYPVLSVNDKTGLVSLNASDVGATTKEIGDKNLYNLGAFDTYVSNGDGTGTVGRKTKVKEYHINDITNFVTWGNLPVVLIPKPLDFIGYGVYTNCVIPNNRGYASGNVPDAPNTISTRGEMYKLGIFFAVGTTEDEMREAIEGLVIQYELAPVYQYEEKVIENQPIRFLPQDGELKLYNEWRKGLNLYDGSQDITDTLTRSYYKDTLLLKSIKEGTYTIHFDFTHISGELSNISELLLGDAIPTQAVGRFTDFNAFTFRITSEQAGKNLFIRFSRFDTPVNSSYNARNIMINEGSHPYPYEPYYGGLVREKDLSGIQLFPEGINPAQTIGGDWEDLGTITTSTGTILHVFNKK